MARVNHNPPPPNSQFPLSKEDKDLARAALRRFAAERLSDDELLAEHRELEEEWALYRADLTASDFRDYPRAVLENTIAFIEWQLGDVVRQMQRRVRADMHRADAAAGRDWQDRFDAMRRADIVEGLQTLGLELRKHGSTWRCPCPLHGGHDPNFSVNEKGSYWHCFTCHRGGDLVAFLVHRDSVSRVDALCFLETIVTA